MNLVEYFQVILLAVSSTVVEQDVLWNRFVLLLQVLLEVARYLLIVALAVLAALAARVAWQGRTNLSSVSEPLIRALKRVGIVAFAIAAIPLLICLLALPMWAQWSADLSIGHWMLFTVLSPEWTFAALGCAVLAFAGTLKSTGSLTVFPRDIAVSTRRYLIAGLVCSVFIVVSMLSHLLNTLLSINESIGQNLLLMTDGWPTAWGGTWGVGVVFQIVGIGAAVMLVWAWLKYGKIIRALHESGATPSLAPMAKHFGKIVTAAFAGIFFASALVLFQASGFVWSDSFTRRYVLQGIFGSTSLLLLLLCLGTWLVVSEVRRASVRGFEDVPNASSDDTANTEPG